MTELARTQPQSMGIDLAAGNAGLSAGDVDLPRLALLQGLSQAVADKKAEAGHWWNTLTSEDYGEVISFVPIMPYRNRVRLKMGEGLMCRSDTSLQIGIGDPGGECDTCPLKEWTGKTPPECGVSHNYLVLVIGKGGEIKDRAKGLFKEPTLLEEPEMGVLQFRSTGTKAAKKINGLYIQTQLRRPGPWWLTGYRLWSSQQKNDRGTFYVPEVAAAGATPDHLQKQALNLARFVAPSALTYVANLEIEQSYEAPEDSEIPF